MHWMPARWTLTAGYFQSAMSGVPDRVHRNRLAFWTPVDFGHNLSEAGTGQVVMSKGGWLAGGEGTLSRIEMIKGIRAA